MYIPSFLSIIKEINHHENMYDIQYDNTLASVINKNEMKVCSSHILDQTQQQDVLSSGLCS